MKVPRNHRVSFTLPPDVPEGPAEVTLDVNPKGDLRDRRGRIRRMLSELRRFRKRFAGRNVNLSEAVIQERREGK